MTFDHSRLRWFIASLVFSLLPLKDATPIGTLQGSILAIKIDDHAIMISGVRKDAAKQTLTLTPTTRWPQLPPDHPYHLPPGYHYPDNLPEGHSGDYCPELPPYPVTIP